MKQLLGESTTGAEGVAVCHPEVVWTQLLGGTRPRDVDLLAAPRQCCSGGAIPARSGIHRLRGSDFLRLANAVSGRYHCTCLRNTLLNTMLMVVRKINGTIPWIP